MNYGAGTLKNAVLYTTLFPCNECAKAIIQSGIKEVVYLCDKYAHTEQNIAAKKMFELAGVELTEFKSNHKKINIDL